METLADLMFLEGWLRNARMDFALLRSGRLELQQGAFEGLRSLDSRGNAITGEAYVETRDDHAQPKSSA